MATTIVTNVTIYYTPNSNYCREVTGGPAAEQDPIWFSNLHVEEANKIFAEGTFIIRSITGTFIVVFLTVVGSHFVSLTVFTAVNEVDEPHISSVHYVLQPVLRDVHDWSLSLSPNDAAVDAGYTTVDDYSAFVPAGRVALYTVIIT